MWVLAYILAIVGLNWLFVVLPAIPTVLGNLAPAAFLAGAVFVLRDYAQRQIGHYVLLATFFAGVITGFMVNPALAVASITAFAISETADWAIFSFTRQPLQQRILLSSLISVPLDTLAFLYLAGFLTIATFVLGVLSKTIGALTIWYLLKRRMGDATAPAH